MKLVLKTDFIDIYDHMFDKAAKNEEEPVVKFHRFSRTSMGRQQAFSRLDEMNRAVVPHGLLHDMQSKFMGRFVVYTDEFAHRGDGKKLVGQDDIHPNMFSSLYIEGSTYSVRELVIGQQVFMMYYKSDHEWKSNVGNVEIEIFEQFEQEYTEYPLYAIDYVVGDTLWAVDLNTAPLIKHTDIDISNEDIVKEIKGWYERMYEL